MKAMVMREWGDPSRLEYTDLPDPTPTADEVCIDVRAVGCNLPDVLVMQGRYQRRPALPFIPGWEVAGVVHSVGTEVYGFFPGQRVFALPGLSAYAEAVAVRAHQVYPLPDVLTFEEGAAFGLAYLTSYAGLVHRAHLRPGETLLVHGAAGGIGLAAVQIGKALGARVIATAGSARKLEIARAAGADVAIDYRSGDWIEQVKAATSGAGADVVYDPVGGDVFDGSMKCIAFEGRLLVVGFAGGRIADVATNRILLKNISVIGAYLALYRERDPGLARQWVRDLVKLAEAGSLKPTVCKAFPLSAAADALALLVSRESYGKVVLIPRA